MERFWNAFGMESFRPCQSCCLQGTTLGPAGLDGTVRDWALKVSLPYALFAPIFTLVLSLCLRDLVHELGQRRVGKPGSLGPAFHPVPIAYLWLEKGHAQTEEPFQVTKDTGMFGKGFWEVVTLYNEG